MSRVRRSETTCQIMLHAVDVEHGNIEGAKFAEFAFFGQHSEAIVGKDAQLLLAYTRAQPGNIPSEIASLVGRKYTVTVTPSSKLLDGDCNYFL